MPISMRNEAMRNHEILLAVNHGPLAEDVLMGVDVGVDQPPALVAVLGRARAGR